MSRLEWVLSGLLALLIVIMVVMMLLFWNLNRQQMALPEAPAANPAQEMGETAAEAAPAARTAQEAFALALPIAQQWAEDAQMVSASATWPEGAALTPENAGWSFMFYSPGRSETGLVSVSGNAARLLRNSATNRSLQPLDLDRWQTDSPAVVETLMAHGGEEFLQTHNQPTLSLTFSALDALQWQAQLIDRERRTMLTVEIDPGSGAVTAIITPEGGE
ncbi:MAG TPA: hypothetical protein VK879_20945 [Candidatus Sulfomarinibacteraceae bacterium]|nr:hypothetical protein [Candidatus Sulfomarinibacteraceae bacterium]